MKEISDSKFILVFKYLHEHLLTRRLKPSYIILDNEASTAFQRELKYKGIDFQLAAPGMHWRNATERAISKFKDQFIREVWSTDLYLTMQNLDRLLEQAENKLKLICP